MERTIDDMLRAKAVMEQSIISVLYAFEAKYPFRVQGIDLARDESETVYSVSTSVEIRESLSHVQEDA